MSRCGIYALPLALEASRTCWLLLIAFDATASAYCATIAESSEQKLRNFMIQNAAHHPLVVRRPLPREARLVSWWQQTPRHALCNATLIRERRRLWVTTSAEFASAPHRTVRSRYTLRRLQLLTIPISMAFVANRSKSVIPIFILFIV